MKYKADIVKPFLSGTWCIWWFVIFLFSLFGMADMPSAYLLPGTYPVKWIAVLLISAFKSTVLYLILWWSWRRRWSGIIVTVLLTFYAVCCLVNFISFSFYGFGISTKLMTIFAQTNGSEVREFLPGLLSNAETAIGRPSTWFVILAFSFIAYACCRNVPKRLLAAMIYAVSLLGLGVTVYALATLKYSRADLAMSTRMAKTVARSVKEMRQMAEIEAHLQSFPDPENVSSLHQAENVCMIVGESALRTHLSLYGYGLPTTPFTDAMRDSLFVFTDALASATNTACNMENILSFKADNDTAGYWYEYPLLVDLMKAAGYRTYWLSNQERSGFWSNSSYVMISHSDHIEFVNYSSEDNLLLKYDEALLPMLRKAFAEKAPYKFIGMHLMGSHTAYSYRYPEDRDVFKASDERRLHRGPWITDEKARTIAEYDNSIRYTDSIVASVIDLAARSPRPSVVVYFSDHGENVYDDRDFIGRDRTVARVPFIIYANPAYRRLRPELTGRLSEAVNRPFSTGNVIHLLMGLTGTGYHRYDPALDVLSGSFIDRPRYVDDKISIYGR